MPDAVAEHLNVLHADLEGRAVADQIVDQLLGEDAGRYQIYEDVRAAKGNADAASTAPQPSNADSHNKAVGDFVAAWIKIERLVHYIALGRGVNRPLVFKAAVLQTIVDVDSSTLAQYERLRRMRNELVHGIETPDPESLIEATREIELVLQRLDQASRKA